MIADVVAVVFESGFEEQGHHNIRCSMIFGLLKE